MTTESVSFFYGEVHLFAPGGQTRLARTVSLVRRTVSPDRAEITEEVLQPSRAKGGTPPEFTVRLTRQNGSTVFDATDGGKTFSGTMAFDAGTEWNWDSWSYDFRLADGGGMHGKGRLNGKGIQTVKTLTDPEGKPSILLREDLETISAERYEELREKIRTGR